MGVAADWWVLGELDCPSECQPCLMWLCVLWLCVCSQEYSAHSTVHATVAACR